MTDEDAVDGPWYERRCVAPEKGSAQQLSAVPWCEYGRPDQQNKRAATTTGWSTTGERCVMVRPVWWVARMGWSSLEVGRSNDTGALVLWCCARVSKDGVYV